MSPTRPRAHQLETESEAAFRTAIPSQWVFRRKSDDYGIDGEAEVFDRNGKATGALFLVQLKATDETDLRKALRIRFRRDVAKYYSALPLPLLVVLYHAPTRRLYCVWFHALDVYYGRTSRLTVSFVLQEGDEWTEASADRIERTVTAYRNLTRPLPKLPFEFLVTIQSDSPYGIARYELEANLRRLSEQLRRLIALNFDALSSDAPNQIRIADDRIAISLAKMPVLTVHTHRDSFKKSRSTRLPSDITLMIGLGLARAGHPSLGAELIDAVKLDSNLTNTIEFAPAISHCFTRAGRVADALRIAERLAREESGIALSQMYLLGTLHSEVYETFGEVELGVLEQLCENLGMHAYREMAASLHYNCANIAKHIGHYSRAVAHYRRARKLDPSYTDREYYQAELAGVRFLMGGFRSAVFHYRRALQLTNNRSTRLRLADALLFSGAYQQAQAMFGEALGDTKGLSDAEWILKFDLIPKIAAAAGQSQQIRRRNPLPRDFDPQAASTDEIRLKCGEALRRDALCALAWFNLGAVAQRSGELDTALDSFLIAALIQRGEVGAWANAIGIALNAGNFGSQPIEGSPVAALLSIAAAYTAKGEDFVLHVAERVREDQRESFVDMIRTILNEIPKKNRQPILRIRDRDGTWHEYPEESPQKSP